MTRAFHTPTDRLVTTRNGRFVFVMLAVAPASTDHDHYITRDICEEPKIRRRYPRSGLYRADTTQALWTVDWYARDVELCEDGRHLVRWGDLSFQPRVDTALTIYREGRAVKSWMVPDLVLNPGKLAVSKAGYWWLHEKRIEGDSGPLYLRTNHGEEYRIDLTSASIVWKALPGPGDAVTEGRTPQYWLRVLTGETRQEGSPDEVAIRALENLGKVGGQQSSAVLTVARFLADPRPAVRLAAAASLKAMGEFAWPARADLLRAYEGTDRALALEALRALAAAGLAEEADVRRLLPHLPRQPEPERALIAQVIGGSGAARKGLLRELYQLLKPQAKEVRVLVCEVVLAGLGRDLEPLARAFVELSNDPDAGMRRAAIERLAELATLGMGGPPAIASIAKAVNDADARVSRRAVQIAGELGPRAAAALPALEALRARSTGSLTRAAERAIAQIRGPG